MFLLYYSGFTRIFLKKYQINRIELIRASVFINTNELIKAN